MSGLGDAVPLIEAMEADRARLLAVDLDHEPAVGGRLALGALDLGEYVVACLPRAAAEERPGLLARDELEEELGIPLFFRGKRFEGLTAEGERIRAPLNAG